MKKILLGTVAIALCFAVTNAKAAETDLESSATFQSAITLTDPVTMAFGTIQFTGSATGNVDMGTNAGIAYTSGYSGGGTGAAGSITINGTSGEGVDISCETTGTLSDGTNTMPITSTQFSVETGAVFGSGTSCAGLGVTPSAHTISATASENVVLLGARIDGSTAPVAGGDYNTTNANGDPITMRVVYQ
ncbi:MAG: hypothetical protein KAJ75_03020 [Alphaproteobacteria bacterium]|nr:hypothetical protein [Alphaproteobacteria bacterium]